MNDTRVVFGSSLKSDGNMSLSYGDTSASLENRRKFLASRSIPWQDLVCAKQVHEDLVRVVTEDGRGKGARRYEDAFDGTDGFLTNKKNIPLAIFTADCLPVFLYDPARSVAAIIHAGWRSSRKNIVAQAISLMQKDFSVSPADIAMHLGPAIRSCCYQVAKEFEEYFPGSTLVRQGQVYLDLADANKRQAQKAGVRSGNITEDTRCTYCSGEEFFSFRRQGDSAGRSLNVIMLR